MKILILCTGNSCRSQMAEGWLKSFDPRLQVFSAGTVPAKEVHPIAVQVMAEVGIDLSGAVPQTVDRFLNDSFDYVITVCDHANESCPLFHGHVRHRLHIGFHDPARVAGSETFILQEFRRVRDEIRTYFFRFYQELLREEIDDRQSRD
ncbi:arsenate reductase ArsC [bacterium]|nr:arsenate reductase ArsC [bacterium]